jgi:hypothetical protein
VTRKEASSLKLLTYKTGKLCKHGHDSIRYTSCGSCYACHRELASPKFRDKNERGEAAQSRRRSKYINDKYGYIRAMWHRAKRRAESHGLPFTITRDDIVIPSICPILGIVLEIAEKGPGNNSPSLDRIDPCLGYVKDNIIVVSQKANQIKSNATLDEINKVVEFYRKRLL